jgi:hypothetical protein
MSFAGILPIQTKMIIYGAGMCRRGSHRPQLHLAGSEADFPQALAFEEKRPGLRLWSLLHSVGLQYNMEVPPHEAEAGLQKKERIFSFGVASLGTDVKPACRLFRFKLVARIQFGTGFCCALRSIFAVR